MGGTSSAPVKPTPEQGVLQFMGDRFPFGDAELAQLYKAYQFLQQEQSIEEGNESGTSVHDVSERSFLQDWTAACLWASLTTKNNKTTLLLVVEKEVLEARLEEKRAMVQVLETSILPPHFGNRLCRAQLVAPGDVVYYPVSSHDYNDDEPQPPQKSLCSSTVDEYTRKARLEHFFNGIANSSRRSTTTTLTVLFETCCQCSDDDDDDDDDASADGTTTRRIRAREFVQMGYRLALAVEFLRREELEERGDMAAYLAPEDIAADPTLMAFADSIVEQNRRKRQRQGLFSETTIGDKDTKDDWVELEDVLEWSDAAAPLFAYILPTLFHYILFPGQPFPNSRTSFSFPQIPCPSAFFASPNSPLLFTLACLSSSLEGTYHRLYTSDSDGLSFNRIQLALLGYSGPTLLIIRAATGTQEDDSIFGAFTASAWKESKDFFGDTDCFLFQLSPLTAVYRPSGNGRNFMYCNSLARSRGYDQQAHGIGFGGTVDQPRLFLSESSLDECVAAPNQDFTFEHGSLLPLKNGTTPQRFFFEVDSVEVWGVGGDEVVASALGARDKAREMKAEGIRRARKVDKAQFLDDFQSGLVSSKAFQHRHQVDGRADQDLEDRHRKKYAYEKGN